MQTEKPETIIFIRVGFSPKEFDLLLDEITNDSGVGGEARYIHDTVMRSLRRRAKRIKKETDNE